MSVGFHRARAAWVGLALALVGMACSDARQPPQPASFDRPTDVDFVCLKDQGPNNARDVAPLRDCDIELSDRALHALVTQSARGEVAAVNLSTDRILDNRRDIPGYTFVPTGELPIAIAVSRRHPEVTYVASYGSRDVRVMSTRALVGLSAETSQLQDPIDLTIDADGGAFGGTPSDMVLMPDESAVLVTLTDVGKIARLPIVQCARGDADCQPGLIDPDGVTFIDLPVSSPAAPVPVAVDEGYALYCGGYERPPAPPIPSSPEPPSASAARPIRLAIDCSCEGCDTEDNRCAGGRVLVADEALPLLHVLDVGALSEGGDALREPIPTGAPTRDVVVTPRVPATFEPTGEVGASTYFVYAIDALDGTVMVLENDALLAINREPGGRVDRLPLQSRAGTVEPLALSLEVITPQFRTHEKGDRTRLDDDAQYVDRYGPTRNVAPREQCLDDTHSVVTPRRLRGVFLSAALADGTVRIVDVHDMGLRVCRDCDVQKIADQLGIQSGLEAKVRAPILVRHHPRLATDPIAIAKNDRDELRAVAAAAVTVRTGQFAVRNNGTVASPLSPSFACFSCAEGFEQALPDPKDQENANAQDDVGDPDAGDPDAGDPDAGDPDAGDPDAGAEPVAEICQEALICGAGDPWTAPPTAYTIAYEAALPNTSTGDGVFVPAGEPQNVTGLLELHSSRIPFCARGVLGRDDIGGARDEAACLPPTETSDDGDEIIELGSQPLAGDRIVIASKVLSDRALIELGRSVAERAKCDLLRAALDEDETAVLSFEIIAAFEDRVAIRSQLDAPLNLARLEWGERAGSDGDQPFTLLTCIGEGRVQFFVRSNESFLVQTGDQGFAHNVIANANGRCVVDAMSGPRHSRRTWTGCEYRDDRVQFVLEPFRPTNVVREPGDGYGAFLRLDITTTAVPLIMNAAQIGFGVATLVPSRLRYSAADEQLYLVDTYQGGLIPIDLDPFSDSPITSFY